MDQKSKNQRKPSQYMKISNETRQLIIHQVYYLNKSQLEVAKQNNIKYSTIKSICQLYQKSQRIEKKDRGGPGRQKSNVDIISLILFRDQQNIDIETIQNEVLKQYNTSLALNTIRYLIKKYSRQSQIINKPISSPDNEDIGIQVDMGDIVMYFDQCTSYDENRDDIDLYPNGVGFETK